MKITHLKRGKGKTRAVVAEALKVNALLLVNNAELARNLERRHKNLRVDTHVNFLRKKLKTNWWDRIIIDDADLLLKRLAPITCSIIQIAVTKDYSKAERLKLGL